MPTYVYSNSIRVPKTRVGQKKPVRENKKRGSYRRLHINRLDPSNLRRAFHNLPHNTPVPERVN